MNLCLIFLRVDWEYWKNLEIIPFGVILPFEENLIGLKKFRLYVKTNLNLIAMTNL